MFKYKSTLCKNKKCEHGDFCRFAHNEAELRKEGEPMSQMNKFKAQKAWENKDKQKAPKQTPTPKEEESTCSICLDKPNNCAFAPCGHQSTCEDCSSKVKECPICRVTVTSFIKIFKQWMIKVVLKTSWGRPIINNNFSFSLSGWNVAQINQMFLL